MTENMKGEKTCWLNLYKLQEFLEKIFFKTLYKSETFKTTLIREHRDHDSKMWFDSMSKDSVKGRINS